MTHVKSAPFELSTDRTVSMVPRLLFVEPSGSVITRSTSSTPTGAMLWLKTLVVANS